MKVLHKKLRKASKVNRFFYNLTLLAYLGTFIYFIIGILRLKGIEDILRYIVIGFFGVWLLIYILVGLVTMLTKKNKAFVAFTIITLLFTPLFVSSSFIVNKFMDKISGINSDKLTYTTNLISLKDNNFNSSQKIGMIESENDIEGNQLAKKLIKKEKLDNKINYYDDYSAMISDLYDGKIGGCFITANYEVTFQGETFTDEEDEVPLKDRVKVLYSYSEEMKNQDAQTLEASKDKKLTEPFTVLIMGVDSARDGLKANQAFNGDTLILVTFNPNTLTATMFSIPRDLYVPIACNHDRYAKINSSAAYGSSCVISTIKELTDIDIDYYVKINFKGVVELVNALGGVEVTVETPNYSYSLKKEHIGKMCEQDSSRRFGDNLICLNPGKQTLNGEQALAYARCRHLYSESDIARNRHQQDIIAAMTKKLRKINSISEIEDILNTVSHNIETNMTPEQILSFYSVGKNMLLNSNTNEIAIKKTYIAYYNLRVWRGKRYTSALGYYDESLKAIVRLMKENLGIEEAKPNYSFNFNYNTGYKEKITGKGVYGGTKLTTLANHIGSNQSTVSEYCAANGINCTFEYRDSDQPYGVIVDQSVHEGTLMKNVTNVTYYMSNASGIGQTEEPINPTPQDTQDPTPVNPTPVEPKKEEEKKEEPKPETPTEPTTPEEPTPEPDPEPEPEPEPKPEPEPQPQPEPEPETPTEPTTPEDNGGE